MTTSQAGRARLDRLAGNGNSEAGIDLASLFRDILNQIQDSTEAVPASVLAKTAQAAVSNHARVEHWYGQFSNDPWDALLADALGQLEERGFVKAVDGGWVTDQKFATGKRLVVVPPRPGKNRAVGVTLYPADERAARGEAEKRRMEIKSLAASLRSDSPGLRPLDKKHLAVLEQSMRDYGYREEFPILIDQYGRILNGRHRIAAAHRAGVVMPEPTTVQVSSDEEAVGFAILANFERGWTEAERNRINADLKAAGLTLDNFGRAVGRTAKRELIKLKLLEDASRSNRVIAELVGTGDQLVGEVRQELRESRSIHIYEFPGGRGARAGQHSVACWCGEGHAEPKAPSALEVRIQEVLLENPQQSNRQVLATVGLRDSQHRRVERERSRMEAVGAIPATRAREGSDGVVRHKPGVAPSAESAAEESGSSSRHASTRSRPEMLMRRISRLLNQWETEPDGPASELEELEALRREIDERIAVLRQAPDHD